MMTDIFFSYFGLRPIRFNPKKLRNVKIIIVNAIIIVIVSKSKFNIRTKVGKLGENTSWPATVKLVIANVVGMPTQVHTLNLSLRGNKLRRCFACNLQTKADIKK